MSILLLRILDQIQDENIRYRALLNAMNPDCASPCNLDIDVESIT
jgi:hypothetical protein